MVFTDSKILEKKGLVVDITNCPRFESHRSRYFLNLARPRSLPLLVKMDPLYLVKYGKIFHFNLQILSGYKRGFP